MLAAAVLTGVSVAVIAGWGILGYRQQRPHTIAVLPLKSLAGEVGSDDVADGLTVQLIADLSSLDGCHARLATGETHQADPQ